MIIEQKPSNMFRVWVEIDSSGTGTMADWSQYVQELSFNSGNSIDLKRATIEEGTGTVSFLNPPASLTNVLQGRGLIITSKDNIATLAYPYCDYAGQITDIDSTRVWNEKTNNFDWLVTISSSDVGAWINSFGPLDQVGVLGSTGAVGETVDVRDFLSFFPTPANTLGAPVFNMTALATGQKMNASRDDRSFADWLQIIADSFKGFWSFQYYVPFKTTPADQPYPLAYWTPEYTFNLYASTSTPTTIATDGTHTSGSFNLKYREIEYGNNTKQLTNSVDITNLGLQRGINPAGNVAATQELDVPYSVSANNGSIRNMSLTTCVVSDNLGWNFLTYTANNIYRPLWRSSGFHKFNATGPTRNNKPTVAITATNTFTGAAAIYLNDDLSEIFTINPGGTTGNYYFRCYMATVTGRTVSFTPRIEWYDSSDTFISLVNGTAVALSTSWQALTVNAAKPSNAAYGVATLVTSNSFAKTTTVAYVSDAYFGRSGGYFSFDGDYLDDATYAYTWTGQRWESPTQLNSSANIASIANYWLTRNGTKANTAYSMTFNMSQDQTLFHRIFYRWVDDYTTLRKISAWVSGVKKNYHIMGYEVKCSLETTTVKLNTLEY